MSTMEQAKTTPARSPERTSDGGGSWLENAKSFFTEVRNEMRRVTWPSRREVYATTVVVILTSAFFALAHYGNPGATAFSVINTGLAGIWLGVAYLKTRNLWFPFGVHLMWNWMQGAFFGIEVSGLQNLITAPFLREIDSGPVWLTGENYGIEGGVACTIALLLSTTLIWFAPFLKPTEELLALTSEEKPVRQ